MEADREKTWVLFFNFIFFVNSGSYCTHPLYFARVCGISGTGESRVFNRTTCTPSKANSNSETFQNKMVDFKCEEFLENSQPIEAKRQILANACEQRERDCNVAKFAHFKFRFSAAIINQYKTRGTINKKMHFNLTKVTIGDIFT